jgi:hypothetical protein
VPVPEQELYLPVPNAIVLTPVLLELNNPVERTLEFMSSVPADGVQVLVVARVILPCNTHVCTP